MGRSISRRVLLGGSERDFDPTEMAVPWRVFREAGFEITFANGTGEPGRCDPLVLDGVIFGQLGATKANAATYRDMANDAAFRAPLRWEAVDPAGFDALLLAGGHAKGMRPYLESEPLRGLIRAWLATGRPLGAICHGVLAVARTLDRDRSVLAGRTVTALPRWMELAAWSMTAWKLGDYYRTYPETVEDEVKRLGATFVRGPLSSSYARPHVVVDGELITARFPGDAEAWALAIRDRLLAGDPERSA
jgi:putative intracellular protease/amidase